MSLLLVCLSTGVALLTIVVTGAALYLHYRHNQFKHIPGPKRSSFWLGNLPEVRTSIEKDHAFIAKVVTNYAQKYGNTFVLWFIHKPIVFCCCPEAIKKALIVDNLRKSEDISKQFGYVLNNRFIGSGLITEVNHDRWLPRRATLNPAFSRKFLHGFMDVFNKSVDTFITRLRSEADGTRVIQLSKFLHRITLDIIGQVAFGVDFETVIDANSPYALALEKALEGFQISVNHPGKSMLPFLMRKKRKEIMEACILLRKTAEQILLKHKSAVEENPDIPDNVLTLLVKTHLLNGGETSMDVAIDDFLSIFIAGQETSATVVSFAVIELCKNPELLERTQKEVDSIFKTGTGFESFQDLNKLEFTQNVLRETLRLYPPAPLLFRQPCDDFDVSGYHVPGGTGVSFGTYACARSPEFIERPEEFIPDRWQEGSPLKPASFAFFPFSMGPRNCIGKNFAMIEMKLLLAKLLRTFNIELDMNQSFDIIDKTTLSPKDGVKCTLSLRNHGPFGQVEA